MANKITTSSATFQPWAVCETNGCPWKKSAGAATRDQAKHHARAKAHSVIVVVEARTAYIGVKDAS